MAEKVSHLGVAFDRIVTIPNWCDDETIVPVDNSSNPLRKQWHLQDKFVVGYSGNLGRAHEYETILAAAEQFKTNPRIVFLFIGGGHRSAELVQHVNARGLADKFLFLPYQSDELLKYSLSVPDVHWISLRPELEGLIVPSKVYGIAAAGRPIIAVTAKGGEIARLVKAYDCGIVVEPGNADEMVTAIIRLSTDTAAATVMGRQSRAMLEAKFTRRHALASWKQVVDRAV